MLRWLAAVAALGLSACGSAPEPVAPPDQQTLAAGAFAYGYRCKGCHEPATPGAATREEMAEMKPGAIVKALTTGKMKLLAIDMPANEVQAIAAYLTSKP